MKSCELLAPAGDMGSAYAAIHYGADAVYLGMKNFSARADAENFTLEQLDEITAFAHSLPKPRRIFVTVNTVILNHEIPDLIEHLAALSGIGIDALIVQDLGVVQIARKLFPNLRLHGSTQMAIHNLAGAQTLRELGFRRVTLARELTISEIHEIAGKSGIEIEVFIHGALCYAYSGLCLYSSMLRGRSGNRGRCNYPCRNSFDVIAESAQAISASSEKTRLPFSMKDLALPDDLFPLREAGVTSFKIEGRKKSSLYVAATTSYYRKLIDGQLSAPDRKEYEDDIKTIFSRPWTSLYVRSNKNRGTSDSETTGHRGTPIGKIEAIINPGTKTPKLQFKTERALERHDGLQIDLPGRPFGFPVDTLVVMPADGKGSGRTVFEAPAGSIVQVVLPQDHPNIPEEATIYCSSSQAVKRRYKFITPKPGEFRIRRNIEVDVRLSGSNINASARLENNRAVKADTEVPGNFEKGRNIPAMQETIRLAFEKLGDTSFALGKITFENPEGLFVPVSIVNRLRRDVLAKLGSNMEASRAASVALYKQSFQPPQPGRNSDRSKIYWSLKTDLLSNISAFDITELQKVDELVIDIAAEPISSLIPGLDELGRLFPKDKIRLALPIVTRAWDEKSLIEKIGKLQTDGWTLWEAANLSAFTFLKHSLLNKQSGLSSDWSIYTLNRSAALQAIEMGVSRFTLSPEDGIDNMSSLLNEFGDMATVVIYQDTPLFISETCAFANFSGICAGAEDCVNEETLLASSKRERIRIFNRNCRTIAVNDRPYCITSKLKQLTAAGACRFRADFIHRRYSPEKVLQTWHAVISGRNVPGTFEANISSALQ